MTELEHFIKQKDVETFGRVCSIARAIKTKDEDYCENHDCFGCVFARNKDEILKILLSEHKEKPKVTDDEKAILRNISKRYEWIFAAQSDEVIISQDRPFKDETGAWRCDYYQNLYFLNRLFPFVKPEDKEPWHIPDLLED